MRRSRWRVLLVVPLFALVGLGAPVPVLAECPYNTIPHATEAARAAREIIVGRVVHNYNESISDFRVRIIHVLRGSAHVGDHRRFKAVYPGWPPSTSRLPDGRRFMPCSPIPGRKGDVIAFALDALAPDGHTRYNAASWISGRNVYDWDGPTTTLGEMQRLAALPQTDTGPISMRPTGVSSDVRFALALVGVLAFSIAFPLLRRRARPGR